uniref:Uncharacterized protein n=1 Tax=Ananas comosus var. bracteatus TaxID=296719 RepID=A0A6V7NIV6_ANACO|nr:unnamed protein product [Ananas comosus var. bracteatus]
MRGRLIAKNSANISILCLLYRYKQGGCTASCRERERGLLAATLHLSHSPTRLKARKELTWSFVADVAPRDRSSTYLTPGHCEETGRACDFAVLDVVPVLVAVEEHRIATRLGSLDSGLREESTKPLLAGFGEEIRCILGWVAPTSATPESGLCFRVGVAHASWTCSPRTSQCGGSWTVATGQGRVYSQSRDGATGFGCCAFRRPGSRQGRRELEPYPTVRARGIPAAGAIDASYTGEIPLYTANLSACPGNETSGVSSRRSVVAAIGFGFSPSRELSQRFVDKNPKLGADLDCEIVDPRVLKNGRLCGSGRGGGREVERSVVKPVVDKAFKTENRIGILKSEYDVQSTFEADNNVLMQQVSKALLREYVVAQKKKIPLRRLGLEHINEPCPDIHENLTSSILRSFKFQTNIFCLRERDLLKRDADEVSQYQAKGESKERATLLSYPLAEDLARAFTERTILQTILEAEMGLPPGPLKEHLATDELSFIFRLKITDQQEGLPYNTTVADYEEVLSPVGFKALSIDDNEFYDISWSCGN